MNLFLQFPDSLVVGDPVGWFPGLLQPHPVPCCALFYPIAMQLYCWLNRPCCQFLQLLPDRQLALWLPPSSLAFPEPPGMLPVAPHCIALPSSFMPCPGFPAPHTHTPPHTALCSPGQTHFGTLLVPQAFPTPSPFYWLFCAPPRPCPSSPCPPSPRTPTADWTFQFWCVFGEPPDPWPSQFPVIAICVAFPDRTGFGCRQTGGQDGILCNPRLVLCPDRHGLFQVWF